MTDGKVVYQYEKSRFQRNCQEIWSFHGNRKDHEKPGSQDGREIDLYLNGTPEDLYDGRLMKDMECAVSILKEKIAEEKKIRIIGDYDIDGVNSTYIFQKGLELAGADGYDIPHRIKDGYGLNRALVDRAYQDGVDTILTCDNGIAAIEEIAYGKEKGMTVIVTDHHEVKFKEENGVRIYQIPAADAVIDPHQKDCNYRCRRALRSRGCL